MSNTPNCFKGLTDSSSWTLGGVDVPFARIKFSKPRIIADSIRTRGLCLRSARIYAIERKDPAACSAARADATEKTLAFLSRW